MPRGSAWVRCEGGRGPFPGPAAGKGLSRRALPLLSPRPVSEPALVSEGFSAVARRRVGRFLPLATGILLGSLSNPQVLKGDEARRWGSVFKRGLVKHKVGIERCVGGRKLVKSTADAILSLTSCFGGVC